MEGRRVRISWGEERRGEERRGENRRFVYRLFSLETE